MLQIFKWHIVKFSNGKYGVRRLFLFGFEFAIANNEGSCQKYTKLIQEFESIKEAEEVLLQIIENNRYKKDSGKPI